MPSVTGRINQIKQPRGGFINPSSLSVIFLEDNLTLNSEENVHASIIGMAVDYLTRYMRGTKPETAFSVSLSGAKIAKEFGRNHAFIDAIRLLNGIKGLDDNSIISACKLVTFDVWYRNLPAASMSKTFKETNPDFATIENIRIMVNRSLIFFKQYGPVTKDGFTFEPVNGNVADYEKMRKTKKGSWGGYTGMVETGDGDFLTQDTLWDFKVTSSEPTNKHTLQLLMYWIMGQHSGQNCFAKITRLGIFNPRLNKVYLYDISNLSKEIIETIEKDIICY